MQYEQGWYKSKFLLVILIDTVVDSIQPHKSNNTTPHAFGCTSDFCTFSLVGTRLCTLMKESGNFLISSWRNSIAP